MANKKELKYKIKPGNPMMLGANKTNEGINFSLMLGAKDEKPCSLILYEKGTKKVKAEITFTSDMWYGNICTMCLSGMNPGDFDYNYRVGNKIITDPYATIINGAANFGENDKTKKTSGVYVDKFKWEDDRKPMHPFEDSIIYRLNVRGFTMDRYSKVKKKGTFLGITEKIDYLKNTVSKNGHVTRGICSTDENHHLVKVTETYSILPFPDGTIRDINDDPNGVILDPDALVSMNLWGFAPSFFDDAEKYLADFLREQGLPLYGAALAEDAQSIRGMDLRRTALNNDYDLTRDGTHLAYGLGRYTAACCYFEALIAPFTGTTVAGNPYRYDASNDNTKYPAVSVDDSNADAAQRAAIQAVKHPFRLTKIRITQPAEVWK